MRITLPILSGLLLLTSCNNSKKATQSLHSEKLAFEEDPENPTFNKPQAVLIDNATFFLSGMSTNPSYGYDKRNPVKVGGSLQEGAANERRFLNALAGPKGEPISYKRTGSCCHFNSPNGLSGIGLLDVYEITYQGLKKPILLYLNMYDYGILKAPQGFTIQKGGAL